MMFRKYVFRLSLILIIILTVFSGILVTYHNDNNNSLPQSTLNSKEERPFFQDSNRSLTTPNAQAPLSEWMPPNRQKAPGFVNNTGSKYASQIIGYSLIFFCLLPVVYYLIAHKKINKQLKITSGDKKLLLITIFCVGLVLRVILGFLIEGHSSDLNLFRRWAAAAANNLSQFYSAKNSCDYPPLYIYVLAIIGKAANLSALSEYTTLLLKLPSILADMITSLLIYKFAQEYLSSKRSILLSMFYIFNPAVFVNSAVWGQVDSFFTLILIAGIILLTKQRIFLSAVFFTAAVLMKPQGIIFLPVLFFELVRQKNIVNIIKVGIIAAVTALVIILPFSSNLNVLWIFKLFSSTLSEYAYASVNAFNFFYLLGANYTEDSGTLFLFSYHIWGLIFIVVITAFSWFIYAKGNSSAFASATALLLISGVFIFSARMHERYLFPALALSILAYIYLRNRKLLFLAAGFSLTAFSNTYYILLAGGRSAAPVIYPFIPEITSILNILLYLFLIKTMFDIAVKKIDSAAETP